MKKDANQISLKSYKRYAPIILNKQKEMCNNFWQNGTCSDYLLINLILYANCYSFSKVAGVSYSEFFKVLKSGDQSRC